MKNNLKIVVGLGKTGLSCVRYLVKQGFNVAVVDSRENPPCLEEFRKEFSKLPIMLGKFDAAFLSQASELILSPGISLQDPVIAMLIKQGVRVIGDIELFVREASAPIVAITGSNGKSTVTTLVGEMAKNAGVNVKVGGNLGTPALELLDKDVALYVMELSSFQLDTTFSLQAKAAVVLNVTPDHLDRYENYAAYLASKQRIYNNCEIAIINRDDPKSFANVKLPKRVISFGLDANHDLSDSLGIAAGFIKQVNKKIFKINELKIKGSHNLANAMAALALGLAVDLPLEAMLKTLKTFPGLPHRSEWIANKNNVSWYNDSKGTNIGATEASIRGLGENIAGKIILIAGGQGKGADFTLLKDVVSKYVRTVILLGEDAHKIADALKNVSELVFADSMENAVNLAATKSNSGDIVLLSPACASYDMFKNFEHRGEVFAKCVRELK